ncbi:MAG: hypothetical protein ABIC82_01865 [bacterium]
MNDKKSKEYKWWQIHEKISSTTDNEYLEKQIKNYFYCALVWSAFMAISSNTISDAIGNLALDSIMIWGIYRKKQWAAIVFFVFFVVGRIMTFAMYPEVSYFTIYILVCFSFFYVGMLSVLRLNELKKRNQPKITTQSQDELIQKV